MQIYWVGTLSSSWRFSDDWDEPSYSKQTENIYQMLKEKYCTPDCQILVNISESKNVSDKNLLILLEYKFLHHTHFFKFAAFQDFFTNIRGQCKVQVYKVQVHFR
jgi:hypothetical protein